MIIEHSRAARRYCGRIASRTMSSPANLMNSARLSRRRWLSARTSARRRSMSAISRVRSWSSRSKCCEMRVSICLRMETLISQHFDLEDQLRTREIADIERRLADVRAESQRRRDKRAEFIKFAGDDIVRDAIRPR